MLVEPAFEVDRIESSSSSLTMTPSTPRKSLYFPHSVFFCVLNTFWSPA